MMRLVEPKISFHELYFREHSKIVRAAAKMPPAYLGGAKSVAGVEAVMADGFDAVVMGRALLHDAALVNQFRDGTATVSGCNACNHFVVLMHTDGDTRFLLFQPNAETGRESRRDNVCKDVLA